ncbi:MAG: alanine--tRNA ligase [Actinobacteria bacterium]|nr:alanine--tRNA ligase [Actinomycetota bacterium]
MKTREIRDRFFTFFKERDHHLVPSSSLVPGDPSLLLTNAGMNQFKPYFQGDQSPPFPRAMSVQKCFRTTDIDEVGDHSHLTFFEMLGNFSFGDYYKEKAIPWAWELVTEAYGLDPDLLWATVYETDDEAAEIWRDGVGIGPDRFVRRGRTDNFWDMGVAGPCGPCSEIFVDLGDSYGPPSDLGPVGNEDRYLEIWNLVFMQNDCNAQIEPVAELPKKNIDTGAGLERIAMVIQNVPTLYETDTFVALIERAEELTRQSYGKSGPGDRGLRVLADHGRAMTFLIADGVLPSNQERGYVLRRVMRRAVRHARLLGRGDEILPELINSTIDLMSDAYPDLLEKKDFIIEVASSEEERFSGTLKQGLSMLEDEIARVSDRGEGIPGDVAFKLHDTFGLPIDLTREIAQESQVPVDTERFETLMSEQRARARAARKQEAVAEAGDVGAGLLERHGKTQFDGYEHLSGTSTVIGIADGGKSVPVASEGDEVEIVLDETVFYAEGGGQVGDRGEIATPSGRAEVLNTTRIAPGLTGHLAIVKAGEIHVGDNAELTVDASLRRNAERAHTATHVLHWILRDRLGEHATQAGSLVEPGRLRFDFNHFEPLGDERVADISQELEERVLLDDDVRAFETSFDFAKSIGAMAIFGEKYGDFVRVVEVGDYSKELCGGTHVPHTSQIGVAVVTSEGSVGANLRRVEALVGSDGLDYLTRRVAVLERAAATLKTNPEEVADKVERLLQTSKDMERRLAEVERQKAAGDADSLAGAAEDLGGARLVVARRDDGVDALRQLALSLRGKLGSAVVVLGTATDGKANLVAAVSKDLVKNGLSARDLLTEGAKLLGGGGGGKPDLAISGGSNTENLDRALEVVAAAARESLRG